VVFVIFAFRLFGGGAVLSATKFDLTPRIRRRAICGQAGAGGFSGRLVERRKALT
jgi:hypothetical protein